MNLFVLFICLFTIKSFAEDRRSEIDFNLTDKEADKKYTKEVARNIKERQKLLEEREHINKRLEELGVQEEKSELEVCQDKLDQANLELSKYLTNTSNISRDKIKDIQKILTYPNKMNKMKKASVISDK